MKRTPEEFHDVLVFGDCLNLDDGLPSLPNKSIDHVITDPPYEAHVHKHGHASTRLRLGARGVKTDKADDLTFAAMSPEQRDKVARELVRVCRGWIIVFCGVEAVGEWQAVLVEAGAHRKPTGCWVKPQAAPRFIGDAPSQGFESFVLVWAGKDGRSVWNGGGKRGVYTVPVDMTNRRHETQKPLVLMQQLILDFTTPGQSIADPFAGGGSTLIAAKSLGRRYTGWEINLDYFRKAWRAVSVTQEQTRMEQLMYLQRARPEAYGEERRAAVVTKELGWGEEGG